MRITPRIDVTRTAAAALALLLAACASEPEVTGKPPQGAVRRPGLPVKEAAKPQSRTDRYQKHVEDKAAEEGKVQIWPVIISDSVFERTKLYAYEAINPVSKPLIGMPPVECEALWARLAEKIFIALEQQK